MLSPNKKISGIHNYNQPFVVLFNNEKYNYNHSKRPSVIQLKQSQKFLQHFENRVERVGREGVNDLMRNVHLNVNKSYSNSERNYQNDMKLPQINSYNNKGLKRYVSEGDSLQLDPSYNSKNHISNKITAKEVRKYPNIIPIRQNFTKDKKTVLNNDVYQERNYVPYSYKDYVSVMRNYKNDKFGGLGANIGTKEWKKKAIKITKMNNYCGHITSNKMGIYSYIGLTPNEMNRYLLEKKNQKSSRYKANKYGKSIILRKVKEERVSEKEIERRLKEDNEEKEPNNSKFEINREEYIMKLNQLKESLINKI